MTWRTYEEIKKYMLCFVLGVAVGFAGGFLCFRENVPGDGDGIGRAREQLIEATESERRTEEELGNAKDRADGIAEQIEEGRNGISEAQRTADRLEENSDRAGSLIGESQSILSGIRERGEEGKGET